MKKTQIALLALVLVLFPRLVEGQSAKPVGTDGPTDPEAALELWVDRNSLGGPCSDLRLRPEVTPEAPWCTFLPAVTQVQAGDVVRVRGGIYPETLADCDECNAHAVLQVRTSGTSDAWIRFVAQEGETVEITPDGGASHGILVTKTWDGIIPRFIEISGFKIRDIPGMCVKVQETNHVVLRDLEVTGCPDHAVLFNQTSDVTLEGSNIHHNSVGGVDKAVSVVSLYRCGAGHVIRGNTIWANTDEHRREVDGHGVTMDWCGDTGGVLIENNVIWHNEGRCMTMFMSDGSTIRNNTCWMNGKGRPDNGDEVKIFGRHHSIYNNILVTENGRALFLREDDPYVDHFDTIALDGNLLWSPYSEPFGEKIVRVADHRITVADYRQYNTYGWGTTALQVDPLLVDGFGLDFRPTAGSPALDTADPSHAASTDILRTPRPQDGDGDGLAVPDRGAFEYFHSDDLFFFDGFETGNTSSWSQVLD